MKLKCDRCGLVHKVLVAGYHFGDRMLEGVDFVVNLTNEGTLKAEGPFLEGDKRYFSTLNEKYWLDECDAYVQDLIADGEPFRCAKICGGEVIVVEDGEKPSLPKEPRKVEEGALPEVPITSAKDFFKGLLGD